MSAITSATQTMMPPQSDSITYTPRKSWKEYELETFDVLFKGQPTSYQAIFYKGNFIRFAGKHYYIYPHEEILEKIIPLLQDCGAEFSKVPKRNNFSMVYGKNQKVEVEANTNHRTGDVIATSMSVPFIWEKDYDPGDGYPMNFGGILGNTLDGTGAFYIAPYSERMVCTNGMKHMGSITEISTSFVKEMNKQKPQLLLDTKKVFSEAEDLDSAMKDLSKMRIRHTQKLPIEVIAMHLKGMKSRIEELKKRYSEMMKEAVSKAEALRLAKNMPTKLLETLDWLDVKKEKGEIKSATISTPTKKWDAFNDITKELSHNTERAFYSTNYHYGQLDKILVRTK